MVCTQSILLCKTLKSLTRQSRHELVIDISLKARKHSSKCDVYNQESFSFIAWTTFGVYLAQNYQIPNLKKLVDTALLQAKQVEDKYRKSKKKGSDDDKYD